MMKGDFYKMTNCKIPVAFICDDGYVMQTSVAITSMLMNKLPETFYEIFVVTAGLSDKSKEIFNSFSSDTANVTIITADTEKYAEFYKNADSRFVVATPAALFKFDLSELIPQYDKIIYLDGDIIIKSDLSSLYLYELDNKYAAAVRDIPQVLYENPHITLGFGTEYFNSGVMLMNLKKMREENITDKLLKTKKQFEEYPLMDQNILNIAFEGNILQLPLKYNVLYLNLVRSMKKYTFARLNEVFGSSYSNISEIYHDAAVIHFSSREKPWKFFDVPLADEWLYYYNESPFGDVPLLRNSCSDIKDFTEKNKKISKYKNVIPVVLSANDNYAPYLAVTVQSIIENSLINNFYDIYVFHSGLDKNMISRLEGIFTANLSVTCIDISGCISDNLFTCAHYSVEMYYRVLIPEILTQYKKAVYIDCDLVLEEDIARLYRIQLDGNVIGACNNFVNNRMAKYLENTLHIPVNEYINSGVLVIDCKKFISQKIKDRFFSALALRNGYACPDQDVLSIVCMGNIKFISDIWNFQWHHQFADTYSEKLISLYSERYENLIENHNIIHYTGGLKPWHSPRSNFAEVFWRYARNSDFYEEIIFRNIGSDRGTDCLSEISALKSEIDMLKNQNEKLKAANDEINNLYQQIKDIKNMVETNCFTTVDISDKTSENQVCIENLRSFSENDGQICVLWDKMNNAYDYRINVYDENMNPLYSLVSADSCIKFNNTDNDRYYKFTVTPRFCSGNTITEGVESEISACTSGILAVSDFKAFAGIQKISFEWNRIDSASFYELRIDDVSGNNSRTVFSEDNFKSVSQLSENRQYICSVRAVSETGGYVRKSAWSSSVCVKTGIGIVSGINYIAGTDFIDLKWNDINDAFYTVEYKVCGDVNAPALCIAAINSSQQRILDLQPDTSYQLRIRADKNEDGKIYKGQYSENIIIHTAELSEKTVQYKSSAVMRPVFPEIISNFSFPVPLYDDKVCIVFPLPYDKYEIFSVTLISMLKNINPDSSYDINVITEIPEPVKSEQIKSLCDEYNNVSLRFIDIQPLISAWGIGNTDISGCELYRLFIPEVFRNYKKAVCISYNSFIRNDIRSLCNMNLHGKAIAAAPLITDFTIYAGCRPEAEMKKLFSDEFISIGRLFNTECAVFDIEKLDKANIIGFSAFEIKNRREFIYNCSVHCFNKFLSNDIMKLPFSWNAPADIVFSYPDFAEYLPQQLASEINSACKNPDIMSFSEKLAPWHYTDEFIKLAEFSPFYQQLSDRYKKESGKGISIIINRRDNSKLFHRTLVSAVSQTAENKEIIISDSNMRNYDKYRCFDNINDAVNAAENSFIMILDENNPFASYNAVRTLLLYADDCVCCGGNSSVSDTDRPSEKPLADNIRIIYSKNQPESYVSQFIWKKEFLTENNISDKIFSPDSPELVSLLLKAGEFIKTEKLICYNRNNSKQLQDILEISRTNNLADIHERAVSEMLLNGSDCYAQREVNPSLLSENTRNKFESIMTFTNEIPYINFFGSYMTVNSETPVIAEVKIPYDFTGDINYQWFISDIPQYCGKPAENSGGSVFMISPDTYSNSRFYYIYCCICFNGNKYFSQIIKIFNTLPVPQNFTAISENGNIILNWDSVKNADGYSIFIHTTHKKFVRATVARKNSHVIKNLQKGIPYLFKIRAFTGENDDRIFGEFSAPVRSVPCMQTPENIKTSPVNHGVKITWNRISDADGYIVNVSDSENNISSHYVSACGYVLYNLEYNKKYNITVQSFMVTGNGSRIFSCFSEPSAVYCVPEPPEKSDIRVEKIENDLQISWIKPRNADGCSAFIFTSDNKYFKSASTDKSSYIFKNIPSGKYIIKVRCYTDDSGEKIAGVFSQGIEFNK